MSSHARQLALGGTRKRKERDAGGSPATAPPKAEPRVATAPANSRLLAGYLAHEFLTKGTLLGRKWDPARAKPVEEPVDPDRAKPVLVDVARLMRADGVHIPGVVNPTQLAHWIQM